MMKFLLTSCMVALASIHSAVAQRPPNIVVILTDDAGYADFGFQSRRLIPTPNIDALQRHGITFQQAYVTAPNCSPSRAGLLTGISQQRYGHEYNLSNAKPLQGLPVDSLGLPLSQRLIPEYLQARGYVSGIVGKWHLGHKAHYHPMRRGFASFFGTLEGSSQYLPGQAKSILRDQAPVPADSLPYLTDAFGDEAVKFIERNAGSPFFLYLAFNAPHVPMQAKPEDKALFAGKFASPERAANAAMTKCIDDNVGKVTETLRRLNLADNTIIVFLNDNGGPILASGSNGSDNYPLRGAKTMMYEGGLRIPMILCWPARIPSPRTESAPVSSLDLLPTFLAASGITQLPPDLDGVNLLPLIQKKGNLPGRTLYWRQGIAGAVRKNDWKLIVFADGRPAQLFRIGNDPSESKDLYLEEPAVAKSLLGDYRKWEQSLAKPRWTGGPTDAEMIGRYDKANEPKKSEP